MYNRSFILGSISLGFCLNPYNISIAQQAVKTNSGETLHNISSYRYQKWQDHFKSIKNGAILSDTKSKCLHFWVGDKDIYKFILPQSH